MSDPARPMQKHWQAVAEAAAADLDNSEIAERCGDALDSPCVVVISVNREDQTFEARCFGDNVHWREMAGKMADAALRGIDDAEPD